MNWQAHRDRMAAELVTLPGLGARPPDVSHMTAGEILDMLLRERGFDPVAVGYDTPKEGTPP